MSGLRNLSIAFFSERTLSASVLLAGAHVERLCFLAKAHVLLEISNVANYRVKNLAKFKIIR